MLGISFFELLIIIAVVGLLVKPSDFPHIISGYKNFIKKFFDIRREFLRSAQQIHNEIIDADVIKDIDDCHYILDNDNKLQKAYNIESLKVAKKFNSEQDDKVIN